jgi:hypothetical protein
VGVVHLANGALFFLARYDSSAGGRIQLIRNSWWGPAVVATMTGVGTPSNFELTIDESVSGWLDIRLDGVLHWTYVMSWVEQIFWRQHRRRRLRQSDFGLDVRSVLGAMTST